MALGCMVCSIGAPVASMNFTSRTKLNVSGDFASRSNAARLGLNTSFLSSGSCSFSSSFAGVSLRPYLNFRWMVVERSSSVMVRAGKAALGCTKRSRSRKSRARTHGFRLRMRTPAGRRVVKRRRAKGRKRLFDYIKGNNWKHEKIQMTAPVLTDVYLSSRGPACDISFVVRLSVAKKFEEIVEKDNFNNQSLHVETWNGWCAAVRKFGGFATDENIVDEAQRLKTSLLATPWAGFTNNTYNNKCVPKDGELPWIFDVAQYNSPFEKENRSNEIWFTWDTSTDSNCI